MKRLSLALLTMFVIFGCNTGPLGEPRRSKSDPSLVRLMLYLGKNNKTMMSKLEKKYGVIQKKYAESGKFYNPGRSFTYFYEGDKIVKLQLQVQQSNNYLKAYTGKLPFRLLRRDTIESVIKKIDKPYKKVMGGIAFEDISDVKKLTIYFANKTISSITMDAK